MRACVWRVCVCVCVTVSVCVWGAARTGARYGFYRGGVRREDDGGGGGGGGGGVVRGGGGGTRRVFGGAAAALGTLPGACALLDRYWGTRCSGAVLAPQWVVTAAHCVSPRLAYVKYNTRKPLASGQATPVLYLYRHPKYRVVQEDEGRGTDVTLLHHDVGLVRTRDNMALSERPTVPRSPGAPGAPGGPGAPEDQVAALRTHKPLDLYNQEVEVLGFGRTEEHNMGEELCSVRLKLVFCERGSWFHCMCGVGADAEREGGLFLRGVCAGDSGGPVLYQGSQVAVTSMGPLECGARSADGAGVPPIGATSVFTSLYQYTDLINSTIHNTDSALRMREVPMNSHSARLASLLALALLTTTILIL